ncbi:MAG: RING-HC finger protein [Proteobacteria bacterium]|nr:RING-HC finger protein [Pseudomonadota bacterium]
MEKKCKYCAMMIPKEAKVCPHCRKKQGTSGIVWLVAIILLLILFERWKPFASNEDSTKQTPQPIQAPKQTPQPIQAPMKSEKQNAARERIDLARQYLADGYKPNKNPAKTTWGNVLNAKLQLVTIKPEDKGYGEAQVLLKEVVRWQKEIQRLSGALIDEMRLKQRENYASTLENNMLSSGMDVSVILSGPSKTTIKLKYVLMSRPLVHKLVVESDILKNFIDLGFTRAILTDGYDNTWNFDIKKIMSPQKTK